MLGGYLRQDLHLGLVCEYTDMRMERDGRSHAGCNRGINRSQRTPRGPPQEKKREKKSDWSVHEEGLDRGFLLRYPKQTMREGEYRCHEGNVNRQEPLLTVN